jgi:dihydrofolate reductase
MIFSFIAAIGKNNELGKDNKLLWNMPADMKHFRETTNGHPVVMGRKTFESIGRPLPNRRNIIITRDPSYTHEGIEVVHSIDEALILFKDIDEEVFNIGGATVYKETFDKADRLYITEIDSEFEADAFFPDIDESVWEKVSSEHHEKDENNPYGYTFIVYERIDKIH